MAIMNFLQTPGPQEVYVRFNNSVTTAVGYDQFATQTDSNFYYIGTCVTSPEPEETSNYVELFTDFSTPETAQDKVWCGKTCLIPLVMNNIQLGICRRMRDQPLYQNDGDNRTNFSHLGLEDPYARGTLTVGKFDFQILIKNVNFFNAFNAIGETNEGLSSIGIDLFQEDREKGASPGRKYFACTLVGYKESTAASRVEEVTMIIKADSQLVNAPDISYFNLTFKSALRFFQIYTENPNDPDFKFPPTPPAIMGAENDFFVF